MKDFTRLFTNIESTTSTNRKIDFLVDYFNTADDLDKLWVIALFSHKRPRRTVNTRLLREWAAEMAGIPDWLFEDTYHIVGDLAETIAKIVPSTGSNQDKSLSQWISFLEELRDKSEEEKKEAITSAWSSLDQNERFLLNKLITGGFRMGVSQKTIAKALSHYLEEEENVIAHKLMGDWTAFTTDFNSLLLNPDPASQLSKPYPFYLAYALDTELEDIGPSTEWFAELKWDGIRGQLIKRGGNIFLWSRGEELITNQFPEFNSFLNIESDFVIDGEILVADNGQIQSFNTLQKRLGRKKPSSKLLKAHPAVFMSYDIMEMDGRDVRAMSQEERRKSLEALYDQKPDSNATFLISELLRFDSWDSLRTVRGSAREAMAEGLMLKSKKGEYKTGRKKGEWFKWKLDPMTIDAVMIYAQRGHGRRANLFTDFTFALKDGERLVPVAKAYSGLTDNEFREISRYVRANTIERFGPVSSVPAEQVFELAFEGVAHSPRHKSGVALRFPRILRWRKTKSVKDIDTLEDLKKMIL